MYKLLSAFAKLVVILGYLGFLNARIASADTPLGEMSKITGKLIEFLDRPTTENYISGLKYIRTSKYIESRSDKCLIDGEELLNKGKFQEAIDFVDGPDCIQTVFVPRHHYLLSAAIRRLPDTNRADSSRAIGRSLLTAIAGSGDGTKARPYLVIHPLAVQDFVQWWLKDKVKEQKQEESGFRALLASDKEVWFQEPK
jgi:hypothetical protein